ncbi:CDP-glycerol glycerophosphotransferase family protein [Streptomyces sp. NPDC059524]|uniref:bifunctional glycosyltransferase/CDP-glycerol:glycerophosphate glycerophosphotransferase n=1 Tax=Streptomyces sp. NPDC059524 TaxID=3346856 RepID=UPI0036998812
MAPRLSIVVPIYDVERYLPACLDSLAAQTFEDIEVVMVDDGSPDGSADIAAAYAARDPRFVLVRRENGGLGAARNTGLRHLSGSAEFVAFVDSDDMVPPDAYRLMIASLDASGSDFVTGNVQHVNSTKVWQSPMHRILSGGAVRGTHVTRDRRLLNDRIACNKVFRRAFWERHALAFPEGVLYEDVPVILPAQFLAGAVDVISEPTYYWRLREGEAAPSITQRRTEPKSVRDRTAAVESVSRFFGSHPDPRAAELKNAYDHTVLTGDLRIFMNVLADADGAFHAEFLRVVNGYLDQVDPAVVMALPAPARIKWLLVRRHALAELLDQLRSERRGDGIEIRGLLRKYAEFPALRSLTPPLPRRARRIDPELTPHAPLQDLSFRAGRLRLEGHAWISRMEQPTRHSALKVLVLRKRGSRRTIVTPLRNTYRPEATSLSRQKHYCYDWAGWEADLDLNRLRGRHGWQEGTWRAGIGIVSGGLVRKRAVQAKGPTRAGHPPYQWLDSSYRLVPSVVKGGLNLRVERVRALVTGFAADGDRVRISGAIRVPLRPGEQGALSVLNRRTGERHRYPLDLSPAVDGVTPFTVHVPLRDVALLPGRQDPAEDAPGSVPEDATARGADTVQGARRDWSTELEFTAPNGPDRRFATVVRDGVEDLQIPLPASLGARAPRHELALLAGANGYLKFSGRPLQARLTDVRWSDGRYLLQGATPAGLDGAVLVVRARDRFDEKTVPLDAFPDGTFCAEFTPATMSGPDGRLPLRSGRWNFFLRRPDPEARGGVTDIPFTIDRLAVPRFPVHGTHAGRRYAFEARWHDFPQLDCPSDLTVLERGPYRQERLRRDVYGAGRSEPLRDAVLYISYNGKQYSDSPRALHEELLRRGTDVEHLWLVRDGQVELPPTARKIRFWGTEWYEALARSRYIVTNAHLPHWLERRPGQVVLQTWHGTMLKKIGLDIEAPKFDPEYHERLRQESRNWSLLVSANRFSTPILERAMGYTGEILETGYPRNDYLYAPDREQRAAEIRKRLGVPPDKKAVLYAPTWRDDLAHRRGQFKFSLRIDVDDARRRLGADHVLLVRRHSNVVDQVPGAGDGFVVDVSEYPDIADLYLAADLLITDYSSVMFDYAHLGRPMLFFTYDLEHYRDTLRGFYFDFEADAPGPLIRTSRELVSAVRDIDAVAAAHRERSQRFRRLFCDLDDGHAAARVVDRMLAQAHEV